MRKWLLAAGLTALMMIGGGSAFAGESPAPQQDEAIARLLRLMHERARTGRAMRALVAPPASDVRVAEHAEPGRRRAPRTQDEMLALLGW